MNKMKSSIGIQMFLLIIFCVVVYSVINLGYLIPNSKIALEKATKNNMQDLAELSVKRLEEKVHSLGEEQVTYEVLSSIFNEVGLRGVDSSYIYVVDEDGIFLYHEREEKVGTVVFNEYINSLLKKLHSDNYEQSDTFQYTDENGMEKYANYYVSKETKWITVMVADKSDVMAGMNAIQHSGIMVTLGSAAVLIFLCAMLSRAIIKPIQIITQVIEKTSELYFTKDDRLIRIKDKKNETGKMAVAIIGMQETLGTMVQQITGISKELETNAAELLEVSDVISEVSNDNSAISEELAASMEETKATADTIEGNTIYITKNSQQIDEKAQMGVKFSNEIRKRADELYTVTNQANIKTKEVYDIVKSQAEDALLRSKAVEKVNVLASTIKEITEQTSLLALNASIEAARAGEMGRGFAVVATEIGNLANQSEATVKDIMKIVTEVNEAVSAMDGCMKEVLLFVEERVMTDYTSFINVSKLYHEDARDVNNRMTEIYEIAGELQQSSSQIAEAITGIVSIIGEATYGINDFANKTGEVVSLSLDVSNVIEKTSNNSKELDDIARSFTI